MTDTLLIDIGGTHARLASPAADGSYEHYKKYRLDEFSDFSDIIKTYADNATGPFARALFSTARTPVNGTITYKRFAGDPDYDINFNRLSEQFFWPEISLFNDLEAAAHGLGTLKPHQTVSVVSPKLSPATQANHVLISIGTGAGHAYKQGGHIYATHGGHFLPSFATQEQYSFAQYAANRRTDARSLIMEDFVSSRGLVTMAEYMSGKNFEGAFDGRLLDALKDNKNIARLFFEFLGIHAHIICSVTGIYGGVYVTGGVIDNLASNDLADWAAFHSQMIGTMVPVVEDDLASVPVFYVLEKELPLLGLASLSETI